MDNLERLENAIQHLQDKLNEHEKLLAGMHQLVKKAGGNGSPPWGERIALLEAWQLRQEKILTPLPGQLAEIKLQLQEMSWQRQRLYVTRLNVLGQIIGTLIIAGVSALVAAAFCWWKKGGTF